MDKDEGKTNRIYVNRSIQSALFNEEDAASPTDHFAVPRLNHDNFDENEYIAFRVYAEKLCEPETNVCSTFASVQRTSTRASTPSPETSSVHKSTGEEEQTIPEDAQFVLTVKDVHIGYILNEEIFLSKDQWNGLIKRKDGKNYRCFLCGMPVDTTTKEYMNHLESVGHQSNIKLHTPLPQYGLEITRKIDLNYHCAPCNLILTKANLAIHHESECHRSAMISARQKAISFNNIVTDTSKMSPPPTVQHVDSDEQQWSDEDEPSDDRQLSVSYASMAKSTSIAQQLKQLRLAVDGKCVVVDYLSYNMIVSYKSKFHCIPCKINMVAVVKHLHIQCEVHRDRLAVCKFLPQFGVNMIRYVDDTFYYCIHCNYMLLTASVHRHITCGKHARRTRASTYTLTEDNHPSKDGSDIQNCVQAYIDGVFHTYAKSRANETPVVHAPTKFDSSVHPSERNEHVKNTSLPTHIELNTVNTANTLRTSTQIHSSKLDSNTHPSKQNANVINASLPPVEVKTVDTKCTNTSMHQAQDTNIPKASLAFQFNVPYTDQSNEIINMSPRQSPIGSNRPQMNLNETTKKETMTRRQMTTPLQNQQPSTSFQSSLSNPINPLSNWAENYYQPLQSHQSPALFSATSFNPSSKTPPTGPSIHPFFHPIPTSNQSTPVFESQSPPHPQFQSNTPNQQHVSFFQSAPNYQSCSQSSPIFQLYPPMPHSPQPVRESPQPLRPSPQPLQQSPQSIQQSPQWIRTSPQWLQLIQPPLQPVQQSPQRLQQSPQSIQPSPQPVQQSPQPLEPAQLFQQYFQSIQQCAEPVQQSPQWIRTSPQRLQQSPQSIQPPPQPVQQSPQPLQPSPHTIQPSPQPVQQSPQQLQQSQSAQPSPQPVQQSPQPLEPYDLYPQYLQSIQQPEPLQQSPQWLQQISQSFVMTPNKLISQINQAQLKWKARIIPMNVFGCDIYISTISFHYILSSEIGMYFCALCNVPFHRTALLFHLMQVNHMENVSRVDLIPKYALHLIRKTTQDWAHCAVCNSMVPNLENIITAHINSESHNRPLRRALETIEKINVNDDRDETDSTIRSINHYFLTTTYCRGRDINDELYVFVKIDKAIRMAPFYGWHTVVNTGRGKYCFVCEVQLASDETHNHIATERHLLNLDNTKSLDFYSHHLIRRIKQIHHCGLCNVLILASPIAEHLNWDVHKMNNDTLQLYHSRPSLFKEALVVETQRYNVCDYEYIDNTNNSYGFKIIVDAVIDSCQHGDNANHNSVNVNNNSVNVNIEEVGDVVKDIGVKKRKVKDDIANRASYSSQRLHKLVVVRGIEFKIKWDNWNGIHSTKDRFKCIICQSNYDETHQYEHVRSVIHATNLKRIVLHQKYEKDLLREIDDKLLNCIVCNVEMPKKGRIQEHIGGVKHKNNFELMLNETNSDVPVEKEVHSYPVAKSPTNKKKQKY